MAVRSRARRLGALVMVGGLVVGGCGSSDDDDAESAPDGDGEATEQSSAVEDLQLVEDGVLTIGTDDPAFPPWFVDDDPTNGEGFEGAVAYAVAEELGFAEDEVDLDHGAVQQRLRPRREGLRLRHQPGVDQRGARRGGRLQRRLLRRQPGDRRLRRLGGRRRHHASTTCRACGSAPRSARPASTSSPR